MFLNNKKNWNVEYIIMIFHKLVFKDEESHSNARNRRQSLQERKSKPVIPFHIKLKSIA